MTKFVNGINQPLKPEKNMEISQMVQNLYPKKHPKMSWVQQLLLWQKNLSTLLKCKLYQYHKIYLSYLPGLFHNACPWHKPWSKYEMAEQKYVWN